jgi:hypothetical protein
MMMRRKKGGVEVGFCTGERGSEGAKHVLCGKEVFGVRVCRSTNETLGRLRGFGKEGHIVSHGMF